MKNIMKIGGSGKSTNYCAQNSRRQKPENSRLSKLLLHDLRNKIPIRGLIENELNVRSQTESGTFRFECPSCGCFHTSVMKNENLARCFGCETNFNPIDMVMAVKKTGFRQSADFLTDLLESGMPANPVQGPARGPAELIPLSCVISSMAERSDGGTVNPRIQSLEKKVENLGKRMDGLQKFLVEILSERGARHEKFGKTT